MVKQSAHRGLILFLVSLLVSLQVLAEGPSGIDVPQIVGGREAEEGKQPWMAALVRSTQGASQGHFCGGTLIAPGWVATAAHCVSAMSPDSIDVILGRHNLSSLNGERIRVSSVIIHPDFDPITADSDLALLQLTRDSSYRWISLLEKEYESLAAPGVLATVFGWGSISTDLKEWSDPLQQVSVPIVSNEICNQPEAYAGTVTENMLCAGFEAGEKDACAGDSGGGLVVQSGSQHFLAGVISWGDGCALPFKYGVYVRISNFADWILDQVGPISPANRPPNVVTSSPVAATRYTTVSMVADSDDPDGDSIVHSWVQLSGPGVDLRNANEHVAYWDVPDFEESQVLVFEVSVDDQRGGVTKSEVAVTVIGSPAEPDSTDEPIIATSRDPVEIVADPNAGEHSQWQQLSGPEVELVRSQGPRLLFRAPDVIDPVGLSFNHSEQGEEPSVYEVEVQPRNPFIFPVRSFSGLDSDSGFFLGTAFLNPLQQTDSLNWAVVSESGGLQRYANGVIGPESTFSALLDEVVPTSPVPLTARVDGLSGPVQSFFLAGTFDRKTLDGVGRVLKNSDNLVFPLMGIPLHGVTVNLLNPSLSATVSLQLSLRGPDGNLLGLFDLLLEGGRSSSLNLGEIFGGVSVAEPASLRVTANKPFQGFCFFKSNDGLAALPGLEEVSTSRLYAPHFMEGEGFGHSSIFLVNRSSWPVRLVTRVFSDDGDLAALSEFEIASRGIIEVELESLRLDSGGTDPPVSGYLELELSPLGVGAVYGNVPRVLGAVKIATAGGRALTVLPLGVEGETETTLMHLTQSVDFRLFTGLVLFNPESEAALVKLEAVSATGEIRAEQLMLLESRTRLVGLLDGADYFGDGFEQVGGHLRIYSDVPIVNYALVGDLDGNYLAAVESQVLKR